MVKCRGIAAVNKEMYSDILRRFRDAVRRKRPEKWRKQQLFSPSRQCSSSPVGFGHVFLNKERCNGNGTSPFLLTWLLLIFSCTID